jgi:hypothetical protein
MVQSRGGHTWASVGHSTLTMCLPDCTAVAATADLCPSGSCPRQVSHCRHSDAPEATTRMPPSSYWTSAKPVAVDLAGRSWTDASRASSVSSVDACIVVR